MPMDIPVSIPKLMNILNSAACLATAMLLSRFFVNVRKVALS
jgi:hypothetical protein